ncbi:MAG TPA: tetratricopeptide repeat protein [Candidatus Angelobacter sp.]|nr:tetratricopeptide repeat protein [Candidatus Angelobacter sp.]
MKRIFLGFAFFCFAILFGATLNCAWAQTFEINSPSSENQQKHPQKKGNQSSTASSEGQSSSGGLGQFGGSIETGRYARATSDALKRGNHAAAMNYAQRLTQVAPNDPRHWFLLGYAARLAGQSQVSLGAFTRGLQLAPHSVEGLSGMAQTYIKMGKADEAKRLLLEVIAANPRRPTDLAMAGELFMQSGDLSTARGLLERSEAQEPSAHAELLLAIAYMKLKQPDRAKALLDRASARSPKNPDIFRAVAQFYRETHDYKSAIETLKRAPVRNADLFAELGYTYELAGQKKESADTYEKAAGMAPNVINLQLSAAQAQMRVSDLDKTRTFLARAQQLDANHYRLHAIRGDLAKLERRDTDAATEYLAALANMPESPAEGILYRTQVRLSLIGTYKESSDAPAIEQQLNIAKDELAKLQIEGPERVLYLGLRASVKILSNDVDGAQADLQEALKIDPNNDNVTLQYGSLLWKVGLKAEAKRVYVSLLQRDPKNRYALEGLGYLSRDENNIPEAEMYFNRLAAAYPDDYVPYLALGDMYTAIHDFSKAEASYEKGYKLAPTNSLIVASAANAAIEGHAIPLAGQWLARATGTMKNDPRVMREDERYQFHSGNFRESARLGEQVIKKLPKDRDVAVYLAYDFYNLGRYDDTLALVSRYENVLPKEANFPLLAGHVHKQNELLQQAIDDYSRALARDPQMVEAYVNRGYVRNDMQDAQAAIRDFEPALKLTPNNGIAHLGLALSNLQLHHSREALDETEVAEKLLGESGATHMSRATAYRQMRDLQKAEKEFRLALSYAPDDLKLHLALADTLYHARHYGQSIVELESALHLAPDDALIYASMATAHARLGHRPETLRYIDAAESRAADQSTILMTTGDALLSLGDREAALQRFTRALNAPDSDRVGVRLEFARLFVADGRYEDARQEVALAFAESRIGEAPPVTTDNLLEAANIFLSTHDFDLATRYLEKSKDLGASDEMVAIGLADVYIAQGDDRRAQEALLALGNPSDYEQNYDYQMAWANIYNQRHDTIKAITSFAHANRLAADDLAAERGLMSLAAQEGTQIGPNVNMLSGLESGAIFEDATIYEMDNKLFGAPVPPRSQQATEIGATFHYHPESMLPINGYFGERNFQGTVSIPSQLLISHRNTFDTLFNVGVTPVLRVGNTHVVFNPGLEFTVRRDTDSPVALNQNLFRQFLYLNTSPIYNWITVRGSAIHESGPFTDQNLSSRDLGASLEFEVGQPWGNNALVTGYSVRDLLFHPEAREFFTTSTWGGIKHKFNRNLAVTGLGRYVRSWRVQDRTFAQAQIIVPGARVEYRPKEHWSVDGAFDFTRGEGFHLYDNFETGFLVSYMKTVRRNISDGSGGISVDYPLRLSFGLQQQSFYSFTGPGKTTTFRPVVKLSFF